MRLTIKLFQMTVLLQTSGKPSHEPMAMKSYDSHMASLGLNELNYSPQLKTQITEIHPKGRTHLLYILDFIFDNNFGPILPHRSGVDN